MDRTYLRKQEVDEEGEELQINKEPGKVCLTFPSEPVTLSSLKLPVVLQPANAYYDFINAAATIYSGVM